MATLPSSAPRAPYSRDTVASGRKAVLTPQDEHVAGEQLERDRQQSRLASSLHAAAETGRTIGAGMQAAGTAGQVAGGVMQGAGVTGLGAAVSATGVGAPVGGGIAAAGQSIGMAGKGVSAAGSAMRQASGAVRAGARGVDEAAVAQESGEGLGAVAGELAAAGAGMGVRQLLHAGLKSPFSPLAAVGWILFAFFALLGVRLCQNLEFKDFLAIGIAAVELLVITAVIAVFLNPCGLSEAAAREIWPLLGDIVGAVCPGGDA